MTDFHMSVEAIGNTKISGVNKVEKKLLSKENIGRAVTEAEVVMILCHIPQV